MQNPITINGIEYTLGVITLDEAEMLDSGKGNFAASLIRASLAASGTTLTLEEVRKLPYFSTIVPLFDIAQEVNGLKPQGEAQAGTNPALTSDTSVVE